MMAVAFWLVVGTAAGCLGVWGWFFAVGAAGLDHKKSWLTVSMLAAVFAVAVWAVTLAALKVGWKLLAP